MQTRAIVALLLLAPLGASAKTPAEEAKEHYIAANKAFNLADYDEAIREFEAAYRIVEDPAFIYNLAQAHRLAGHLDKAVRFYRNYLRLDPGTSQKAAIEQRIAEMEAALATQRNQLSAPPTGTIEPDDGHRREPPPREPEHAAPRPSDTPQPKEAGAPAAGRTLRAAGIAVTVAGVALAGVAVGLGVVAASARDEFQHPPPGATYDPDLDTRANLFPTVAIALGAAGAVALVTGVILLVRGYQEGKAQVTLAPAVAPGRAGALLHVSF